jgi:signal transduction histidine kinase
MLRLGATSQLSEPSDDYLDIIDQEVASANKIITDLLTFARIKPANLISTDIHGCLEELFKKFVPPENVNVKIDLPQSLPKVYVDDKQIDQVMANLIINAYQAIPNKGSLTITAMIEKNMLRLDFTDTGIGIPPENLEKIFEPLFSTKTKGIGLGLTISKMLIEANGGKIKVRSTLNKGTTFSIYLPREQPSKYK